MRDKLKDWQSDASDDSELNSAVHLAPNQAIGEAESALVALGYKPKEAERAVKSVASEGMSNQDLIRNALKSNGEAQAITLICALTECLMSLLRQLFV